MIMKKYILTLSVLAAFYGCQHDIARDVDYNITLSAENSYLAGETERLEALEEKVVPYSAYAASARSSFSPSTIT